MQYKFKQACRIYKSKPRNEKGLLDPENPYEYDSTFKLGTQEVPESVESDPFFLRLVKAGLIEEVDVSKELKPETAQERSKRLYDKLTAKKDASPVSEPEPEQDLEEHSDDDSDSSDKPKKKKK